MTTPLPPTDPSTADEQLPGEAELSALYRQLPQNEPSAALDAAVLRAAAAALTGAVDPTVTDRRRGPREPGDWVHPKPETLAISSIGGAKRRERTPRWLISLGSAASLVLVAGMAWQLRESSPPPPAQIAQQHAVAAAAADMPMPEANAPMAAAAPAVAPLANHMAEKQATAQADAVADTAKKLQQDDKARSAARMIAAKPMATPPPAAEVASVPPAPPAPPAAPAPPAPPAMLQETSTNASAGTFDASAPVAAAPVATGKVDSNQETTLQPGDTPTQELDKIQQLFAQGHHDQAMQRLRSFHKAHPQWPLLPALQAHLQEP
ncbi:hypothetical protein PY254_11895 [Rhodanobacter sp. AS-Z3]|uniref:hypothetical protein n=1 Tax=Rhodanobacter sp. AS-Z3 TaxID=3031330 RepID=UPI0024785D23|nr:hypothetical protein [Rhodanobacter sp. AS-Z3]WEN13939.1 hypothetical protein PY254_11895 [Rhodanobacter sp. AS-Z3]